MIKYYKTRCAKVVAAFQQVEAEKDSLRKAANEYGELMSALISPCKAVVMQNHDCMRMMGVAFDNFEHPCFRKPDKQTRCQDLRTSVAKKDKDDHIAFQNIINDCAQQTDIQEVSFKPIFDAMGIDMRDILITSGGGIINQSAAVRYGFNGNIFYLQALDCTKLSDQFKSIFTEITGTEYQAIKNEVIEHESN